MAEKEDLRVPPQNLEAEQAILGGVLMDPKAIDLVVPLIKRGAFYKEAHNRIYDAMLVLYEKGEPVDSITLTNYLSDAEILEKVGGAYYITGLVDALPSAANIERYCQIVDEKYNDRLTISVLREGLDGIFSGELNADDAQGMVFKLSDSIAPSGFEPFAEAIPESLSGLEHIYKHGKYPGLSCGFTDIDNYIGGLCPGDLIILAGRPSMGKTSLGLSFIKHAGRNNHPSAVISIESSRDELLMRWLLQARSNDDMSNIQKGYLTKSALESARFEADRISKYPVWIDDSGLQEIDKIRAKARRLKALHGIEILMVDYLQLVSGSRAENRQLEIGEYTRKLKILAKDLSITVLCLSQLSRGPETRAKNDRRPVMADLRESGNIEQDADKILFLYRPEVYGITQELSGPWKDRDNINLCEVIIAKDRNGPTGMAELTFLKHKAEFLEREQYHKDSDIDFPPRQSWEDDLGPPDDDVPF